MDRDGRTLERATHRRAAVQDLKSLFVEELRSG